MKASELHASLKQRGFTLKGHSDGKLTIHPASELTATDRLSIKQHKRALLSLCMVEHMAAFYDYSEDELAYALDSAATAPEAWRVIVQTSMDRWGWTLGDDGRRHPYLQGLTPLA